MLNRKPGSAILIALFVMATVGVVAFGSTRTYISELHTTTNLTITDNAYYAAESGLEQGLLAYRENPNAQWSEQCSDPSIQCSRTGSSVDPTLDTPIAIKPDLANGATTKVKVGYLGGELDGGSLKQDESRQITIPTGNSATLNWTWATIDDTSTGIKACNVSQDHRLRISYINPDGTIDTNKTLDDTLPSQTISNISLTGSNGTIIQIRPLGCDLSNYSVSGTNIIVNKGNTTIDGIGEFGSVSRQLEAKIDRSTNQLLGIFDYTLYGKDSIQ